MHPVEVNTLRRNIIY